MIRFLSQLLAILRTPTIENLVTRELRQARRDHLASVDAAAYHTAMAGYYAAKVERLRMFPKEGA